MDIHEIVKTYGMPTEETSATVSLIYGYREKRFKVSEIHTAAKTRLTNSICCSTVGMDNFDERLEMVLAAFRRFNVENHL